MCRMRGGGCVGGGCVGEGGGGGYKGGGRRYGERASGLQRQIFLVCDLAVLLWILAY